MLDFESTPFYFKIYTEKLDNPFKLCKKFELTTLNNKKIAKIRNTERKPIKKAQRTTGEIPYYGATGQNGTIDKFIFEGFPPRKKQELENYLECYLYEERTVVLFESPRRIKKLIDLHPKSQ